MKRHAPGARLERSIGVLPQDGGAGTIASYGVADFLSAAGGQQKARIATRAQDPGGTQGGA